MNKEITSTPGETQEIIKKFIIANDVLISKGEQPVSLSIVGPPGLGKTTICREVANQMGKTLVKKNFAQFTEPAELVGHFSKEYEMTKVIKDHTGKEIVKTEYVTEGMLNDYVIQGFKKGKSISRACPPEWVSNIPDNSILLLDDFSRGNQLMAQCTMEIVNERTMEGWGSLLVDKKIQILLTENPDDGEYNVVGMDKAQSDRMARISMKWDAKDWAIRAEQIKLDERLLISRFR
jgi:MoxR-like ATPase